jgi:uncharacterized protein
LDPVYVAAPPLAYLIAGGLKFAVNSWRERRWAFGRIGLGGAPSTHTTIVVTTAVLIGLRAGFGQPGFAVALALAMIVMIDAMDLRRKVGRHATALKTLFPDRAEVAALRERLGHSPFEVAAGIITGIVCAAVLNLL